MGTTFRGNLRIESSQKMENEPTPETFKLADKILEKNGGKDAILEKGTPDFNTVPTTNEGMYATEDNYVTFASKTWRIMRINGDGTIRLIMQNGINSNKLISFNTIRNSYTYMYYTNSTAQKELNDWYSVNNLTNYENEVVTSQYCEQAKTSHSNSYTFGSAVTELYTNYTPSLLCTNDGNGKGIINEKVGLITYDELVMAGGKYDTASNFYLNNGNHYWSLSPSEFYNSIAYVWRVNATGTITKTNVATTLGIRPIIYLNKDILASGLGTIDSPYIIQTNE